MMLHRKYSLGDISPSSDGKMDDFEILRPHITRIGKRQYRKLAFDGHNSEATTYDLDYSAYDDYNDDEPDCESNIETISNGYKTCVDVPNDLIKFICGKRMENKINIERETNTQIKLPKPGAEGLVVISGASKKGVSSCRHRIELIVESSRLRIPPTHFLSFPLFSEEMIKRLEGFKRMALETCKQSKGIDASIFTIPQKLHLTIGVMTLLTESEVESAGSLLEKCFEEVVRPQVGEEPIVINLKGVEYMNDDPSKVDVLYAKVYETSEHGRLQKLADTILKYFTSKGLIKEEYGRVKLHATIINTKLRDSNKQESTTLKSTRNTQKSGLNRRTSFDAREVIEVFKDFQFGKHHLDRIHLSQRGVYDSNGHYHCCKSVALP